jgi:hypothetical protein
VDQDLGVGNGECGMKSSLLRAVMTSSCNRDRLLRGYWQQSPRTKTILLAQRKSGLSTGDTDDCGLVRRMLKRNEEGDKDEEQALGKNGAEAFSSSLAHPWDVLQF